MNPWMQAFIVLLLAVLMFGMGATLTFDGFRAIARRPRPLLVGMASQFGWMPLIALGLGLWLGLPPVVALGLLVVGATPGGTTSNLFTYYARGDVALSVAMTSTSTVCAVVAMPVLLALYAPSLGQVDTRPLLMGVVQTLGLMILPLAGGMWLRRRSERAATRAERAGSLAGAIVVLALTVTAIIDNGPAFLEMGTAQWAAALLLGVAGMTLGYGAAAGVRLDFAQRRAVTLETGIQNSGLALGIIASSAPQAQALPMLRIVVLYALLTTLSAGLVTAAFRAYRPKAARSTQRLVSAEGA